MVRKAAQPKTPKRKRASFSSVIEEEKPEVKEAAPAFQAPQEEPVVSKEDAAIETLEENVVPEEEKPTMVVEQVPALHKEEKEEPAEEPTEEPAAEEVKKEEEKPDDQATTVSHFAPVENADDTEFAKITSASRSSMLILVLVAIVSFVVGMGITYGAFQFIGMGGNGISLTKASPSPEPSSTPEPTEKPVDRSSIAIEILNGSGKAGAAKKAADVLAGLGYKIEGTGNADKSSYEESVLEVQDSVDEKIITLLRTDLEKNYTIASQSGKLSSDAKTSVRFIVGKK